MFPIYKDYFFNYYYSVYMDKWQRQFGEVPLKGWKQHSRTYLLSRCIWAKGNLHHNADSILLTENETPSIHVMLLIHLFICGALDDVR